jgi:uncharacterized protein (DUF342 family)
MSSPLDTSHLDSFVANDGEVNIPSDVMEAYEKKKAAKLAKKKQSTDSNLSNGLRDSSESDELQLLKEKYEAEKKARLQAEERLVESAKNPSISLTINEKKLISAIKSEILIQETEEPIISTRKLRKVYKVHPNYISGALENLLKNGIISRKKAIYSGKIKTFKYSIL